LYFVLWYCSPPTVTESCRDVCAFSCAALNMSSVGSQPTIIGAWRVRGAKRGVRNSDMSITRVRASRPAPCEIERALGVVLAGRTRLRPAFGAMHPGFPGTSQRVQKQRPSHAGEGPPPGATEARSVVFTTVAVVQTKSRRPDRLSRWPG
jgi:hypothetical protein